MGIACCGALLLLPVRNPYPSQAAEQSVGVWCEHRLRRRCKGFVSWRSADWKREPGSVTATSDVAPGRAAAARGVPCRHDLHAYHRHARFLSGAPALHVRRPPVKPGRRTVPIPQLAKREPGNHGLPHHPPARRADLLLPAAGRIELRSCAFTKQAHQQHSQSPAGCGDDSLPARDTF